MTDEAAPALTFRRAEWAALRAATPLTLTERDLDALRGLGEHVDVNELTDVYLPLTRLLNLSVTATQRLRAVSAEFLGAPAPRVPYIIGIAGSVAVGKSTFARTLRELLSRWPEHPSVDLVTTDGFLHPNRVLAERGLMQRKGFPESYDTRALLRFVRALKAGAPVVRAPVYSHVVYDIVDTDQLVLRGPDIVLLEGLNVLQRARAKEDAELVSDSFDFSIYLDADETDLEAWYVSRFLALRETVFQRPDSYFQRYASLSGDEAAAFARSVWRDINGKNLKENIAPTRTRASVVLRKGADHRVTEVSLRRW
jgi:type I pantothenate kinase